MKHESNSSTGGSNRRAQLLWALLLLAVLGYAARFAWNAHKNLVTFDVRDMDLRKVVKKMEWQTWEDIHVHQEVQGKITLKVINMPLEEALRIVSAQAQSRSVLFYALYSDGASLKRLEQSLRGEVDPATHGWTNLATRGGGGFGGFGGPGGPGGAFGFNIPGAPAQVGGNGLVSLNLAAKTVDFAALAFTRFAQTRVVPEDGVKETVTLTLDNVPVEKAVAKLAKAAKRKWVAVYALQAGFGFDRGGDRQRGPRGDDSGTNRPPRGGFGGFGGADLTDAQRDEMRAQREAQELALREALPAEARAKYEQAQQARESAFGDMQNMTPEQMRDRFTGQNSAAMNKMMRDRVMNSTPEQRAQQGQRRGGPGGGGRGPGGGGPGGGGPR